MADKKISELDLALQINNDAVFPFSQQAGGEDTTYKASITQLGAEVAEDQTFSNLQTTSKKLVGAINELNGKGSVETATIQNVAIATFPDGADNVPVKSLKVDIDANLSGVSAVTIGNVSDNTKVSYFQGLLKGTYGFVDLGSLSYTYTSGDHSRFYANVSDIKKAQSSSTIANILCSEYTPSSVDDVYDHTQDKIIGVHPTNSQIWIYDSSFTDVTALKTYLSGKYLIYELATPTTPTITKAQFETLCQAFGINGTTYPISLGETLTQGGVLDVTTGLLTRTDETTSQLTPTQVKTLLGNNNIFADSGNVDEVVYFKTGCESIARLIEAYM